MLYEYLITIYKIIVGLITPEVLITIAFGTFGFYMVWICVALFCSFQRKFNSRCHSLVGDIRKNRITSSNVREIDERIEKISGGFYHGWRKFKNSTSGKPSDFITRRESLDVEINGGALNQGKSIMRAFINLATFVLFLLNIAYIGNEKTITFIVLAESMILPFVFNVIMKMFYFLQNSLKQRLYKLSVEGFYECIDLLDGLFGATVARDLSSGALPENLVIQESIAVVPDEAAPDIEDSVEKSENPEEVSVEGEENKENQEPEEPENILDKYDVFKKKNIDVDKLMNETPKSGSTLPYIDVDSDYVIKDDDEVGAKAVGDNDSASSILGGMMQNTSGIKKGSSFIDIEKPIAEIDNDKIEELKKVEEKEPEIVDPLKAFEVNQVEETAPVIESEPETVPEEQEVVSEPEPEVVAEPAVDNEILEEERAAQEASNIANVVSGFKANRSKLATGGVIIERNEPIARRERREVNLTEQSLTDGVEEEFNAIPEITRPTAEVDTDAILNSIKSSAGGYDNYSAQQGYNPQPYGVPDYNQSYGYGNVPTYTQPISQPVTNPGYVGADMQGYQGYNQTGYGMNNYQGYNQNVYAGDNYQNYAENQTEEEYDDSFEEDEEPTKKKVVRTKENEPRPRNLRAKTTKQPVKEEPMAKRGRPKKQEVSDSMTIKNEKEFNEVLSRAEKLMKKSEEGLSESQSKRIEKELKMLMDAMNRYKENK